MTAKSIRGTRRPPSEVLRFAEPFVGADQEAAVQRARIQRAETILRERRRRDEIFGADLFAEPAFDVLLELYLFTLRRGSSAVAPAYATAAATDRYVVALQQRGLVASERDPLDSRRTRLKLTVSGIAAMQNLVDGGA